MKLNICYLILVNSMETLKQMINIMEMGIFLDIDSNNEKNNIKNNIINNNIINNNIINNNIINNNNNNNNDNNNFISPIISVIGFDCEWKPENYYRYKKKTIESVTEKTFFEIINDENKNTKIVIKSSLENNVNIEYNQIEETANYEMIDEKVEKDEQDEEEDEEVIDEEDKDD